MSARTCFEKEAKDNSGIAYCYRFFAQVLLFHLLLSRGNCLMTFVTCSQSVRDLKKKTAIVTYARTFFLRLALAT